MGPKPPLMSSILETNKPTPTALVQVGPKSHKSKIKQHTVFVDLSTRLEFSINFQNRDRIEVFLLTKIMQKVQMVGLKN